MSDYLELVDKFLNETGYGNDERVLAIIVYGSRVIGNYSEKSDLDIAMFVKNSANYKAAFSIGGVKIDCNIFSANDIFDIAYEKRVKNNSYFNSILKNGKVIKDSEDFIFSLCNYLEEIDDIRLPKQKLSQRFLSEIISFYNSFKSEKCDYYYFNLLEKLRLAFHYINNCSYVSMLKVYDIYSSDSYADAYCLKLPNHQFRNLFFIAIGAKCFEERISCVEELIKIVGVDKNKTLDFDEESNFWTREEIKYNLIVAQNKASKVIDYLSVDHPFGDYSYNVLINHLIIIYVKNGGLLEDILKLFDNRELNIERKIEIIKELLGIVDKDYHLDYENYMLKLNI